MARQREQQTSRFRRPGIRSRLVGLLAIPLVGLLILTGFGVLNGAVQAGEAAELDERTSLALSAYDVIADLQNERASLVASRSTTPEQRANTEASVGELTEQAAAVGGELESMTQRELRRVQGSQRVAASELGGRVALTAYSAAINGLLEIATLAIDPAGAVDGAPAATVDYLARAQAASAEERDLVVLLSDEGEIDAQAFQDVMRLASAQESYTALAATAAGESLGVRVSRVGFSMSAADSVRRDVFTASADPNLEPWISGLDQRVEELSLLQGEAEVQAIAAVDDLAASSRVLFVTALLAALAVVLVSILLLRRATRSISRPLQDLAAQAQDVARVRLPEAVRAQRHDGDGVHLPALRATGAAEVYEVAAAFNEVQDTALRLATEQAALRVNQAEALTNLGRRNQTLLARQLDFISSLETRETDPVFLDHLFKLDHLASRMRRNAESLLILAGSETPRRRRTTAEVAEVVRAAMSEVEEFERVRIGHLRDSTLAGPVVIDLVHLLAELIENALGFSPPETTVEIDGRALGQGGYQFAVIDHGVGMSDVELMAANHRIRGLDELEGMPTRYLGQYVVAKLAAKIGAMVKLQPSAGGKGVTALVILPAAALLGQGGRAATAGPLPGSRASREQGPVPFAPGAGVPGRVASDEARLVGGPGPAPLDLTAVERAEASSEVVGDLVESDRFDAVEYDRASMGIFETSSTEVAGEGTEPVDEEIHEVAVRVEPLEDDPVAADPWSAFRVPDAAEPDPGRDDGVAVQESIDVGADPFAAVAKRPDLEVPPPPPPIGDPAPEQREWAPAFDGRAQTETADEPTQLIERVAAVTGGPGGRTGGLSRRVPGATLGGGAPGQGSAAIAPVDRSADAVRSMLSSFQAGRSRGRGAPSVEGPSVDEPQRLTDAHHISEVQDGRSSQ